MFSPEREFYIKNYTTKPEQNLVRNYTAKI